MSLARHRPRLPCHLQLQILLIQSFQVGANDKIIIIIIIGMNYIIIIVIIKYVTVRLFFTNPHNLTQTWTGFMKFNLEKQFFYFKNM